MKPSITFSLLLLSQILLSQTNLTFRSVYTFNNKELANLWGYADANGNEYALVGTQTGMSIINVTLPESPVLVVNIPGPVSDWREIKTYGHFAYVVTEGSSGGVNVGLTIVDLSQLPNININNTSHVRNYRGDGAILNQLSRVHALHVDESAGFLYLFGSTLFNGRAIMLDLNTNPFYPTYAGYVNTQFSSSNYVHDGYVDGNMMYGGHINAGFFSIINTTDKTNPTVLATQPTPNTFTHNTWLNGSTLFTTDERNNSFLAAYDVSDPEDIRFLDKIQLNPGSNAIVHNTYIHNNYAITSWYTEGLSIVDVSRPQNLVEVGNYDTYPAGSGGVFQGCWGVYPYLPSGNIIASNINDVPNSSNGQLFVLTPNYVRGCYLEGKVTDAVTGFPINGAKLELISGSPTQAENSVSNGDYKMGRLQGGTFTLKVSQENYESFTTSVTLSNGVLTTRDVPLQPLALPVEMLTFTVKVNENTALLDWETASERDNAGFEVQHSTDGVSWNNKGFVPARGGGEARTTYQFVVNDLSAGVHFFRLQQKDLGGSVAYSPVRSIVVEGTKLRVSVQPTVVADFCTLRIQSSPNASLHVEIFRADGQPTGLRWTPEAADEQTLALSLAELAAGSYFVVVQTEDERVTSTFVKN